MGSYTREQIDKAMNNCKFFMHPDVIEDIFKTLDKLDTPEQSEFVEDFIKNWTVRYRSRGGALSLAQEWALKEEAHLIEAEIIKRTNLLEKSIEFYSKELEKLERRIEEVERGNNE